MLSHSAVDFLHANAFKNPENPVIITYKPTHDKAMETQNQDTTRRKNKGGRPCKTVKRDQLIAVKCTLVERKLIEAKAKKLLLSVSEYLRVTALGSSLHLKNRVIPKEVLGFTATLNHLAANLNQIAKKRNGIEELSISERAELKIQSEEVRLLTVEIKNYIQQ